MRTNQDLQRWVGLTRDRQSSLRAHFGAENQGRAGQGLRRVVIEACGSAHHWGRTLGGMGHTVKLIAPQLAKPSVKRGKNDTADAEGL